MSERHSREPTKGGPPPWINTEIQQRMAWRDGDIVISTAVKSGTTWTMNIVHQLRSGGDPDLTSLYAEVPWVEFVPGPTARIPDLVARLDAMPDGRRRAFKSHSPPPALPYHPPRSGRDVQYIVVARHPDEVVVSLHSFIGAHSDAWLELWDFPKDPYRKPDFPTFFREAAQLRFVPMIFQFLANWWPYRNEDNVLFLHFADMKRDHEGSVQKIAEFLGYEPTAEQWPTILECTSFRWMKAHEHKFDARNSAEVPTLEEGAMIRKGELGGASDDGMTEEISAVIASRGREIVGDEAALTWIYEGGPVPA